MATMSAVRKLGYVVPRLKHCREGKQQPRVRVRELLELPIDILPVVIEPGNI